MLIDPIEFKVVSIAVLFTFIAQNAVMIRVLQWWVSASVAVADLTFVALMFCIAALNPLTSYTSLMLIAPISALWLGVRAIALGGKNYMAIFSILSSATIPLIALVMTAHLMGK